ncbi:guanine nucleotide exchange factor for Rab-3A isoform X11 [Passer montanus]|uniref:guanine nucleotide exchange factor for Rab-3A isoform X11 n=1 Tax=Passer montanus TaxID=9160 RepID=UPI00195FC082|nr:guanine nucleotide exchange factor for Rab-3A isoform X11 [Passer montanus]
MMLSTHGMMNLSGVMLVHGGAGQASIPVGMEKSGPAPKPGGKSLTWRELELLAQETTPSDQHCRKHVGPAGKSADPAHFFAFSTETNFRSQVSLEEESQNPPSVGHWKPLMPSKGDKEEAESGCQDAGGVHEPQSTEQLNVSRLRSSSVEIREKGSEFLRDELHKAQKELKLKDKECERLSKVREQLEQELEELTASLFEEAHKMVREANTKQAAAEKQLREARGKVDSILFAEFQAWKESPTLDKSCSFLDRIYREDVGPCLDFTKQELSELVQVAVEQNTLTIEPVASQTVPVGKVAAEECGGPKKCALSGLPRTCKHRIMLGDSGNYYYISPSCRARITAVCNFFTYIRYIQQGLVRQDAPQPVPGQEVGELPNCAQEDAAGEGGASRVLKTCCKKEAHKCGCPIPGSVQDLLGGVKNCTSEHHEAVSPHADATHKLCCEEVS